MNDVLVIGGGHAGIEAALASARMGVKTSLLSLDKNSMGRMSCNPAIGGLAKGQIVREIDALGGEMARATDETGIQFRWLNTSKGPAVRSPRAQCDKLAYEKYMQGVLQNTPNLTVIEDTIEEVQQEEGRITGAVGRSGEIYSAKAIIITTGTFLKAIQHCGEVKTVGGRVDEPSAETLSDTLRKLGFEIGRLKTGTPPRLKKGSIDFSKLEVQHGDDVAKPFSFFTDKIDREQHTCWISYTNPKTHDILRENLHRSPMHTGQISSAGPRYCPSIEDKIVRFADRERHMLFLEPESLSTDSIYVNGISTSTPPDVQDQFVRTIPGLEKAEFLKYGYAVEYDYAPPHQLHATMETRKIEGLYFAGQINGTSGYEEAGGQGLVAGINAALKIQGKEPFVLGRDEAYIGVMIDDLISMEHREPYRMFTSRAEYRLMLRSDNADRRLMKYGYQFGLHSEERWNAIQKKEFDIAEGLSKLGGKVKLLRRPEKGPDDFAELIDYPTDVKEQIDTQVKYEGYIQRQEMEIARMRRMEEKKIPETVDFTAIKQLSNEAKDKLNRFQPRSIRQASRIAGVTPADIQILLVHLAG
mgnify:CR=1 FL=1